MLNGLDLFCGCGGMSLGLKNADINMIYGIDIWKSAIDTYNKNLNHLGICADLTNMSPEKFNEIYNKDNIHIDVIFGGIPCQSFSQAGKRDKNDRHMKLDNY